MLDGVSLAELLTLAVTVCLSPVPIAAAIVILTSRRARPNGLAFACGWTAGIAAVGTVVLVLADSEVDDRASELTAILKLALGIVLIAVAIQQWRSRPRAGERAREPRWLRTVDELSARQTAGLGILLAVAYPKTLLLVATAAATMAETTSGVGAQAAVLAGFVAVGASGVVAPVAIQMALGERSEPTLARLRDWLSRHAAVVVAVLFVIVGATLLADALPNLLG